jgi:uncharacterized protein DUF6519
MKSDKSRDTFLPEKHLSSVRLQQGRVLTDADWNEQVDIQRHLDEVSNRDIIGPTGVPLVIGLDAAPNEDGFKIDPPTGGSTDLQIRHGRIYVDGILCELEATTGYTTQPDFPSPPPISDLAQGVLIVAYLDVWHRHIGTIEDPTIREVALGGPDTATRAKTVWQVKLLQTSATTNVDHEATPEWQALVAPSTGKLNARAQEPSPADTPCVVPPEAGFRRLENQLYRVEIHTAGSIGPGATGDPPTFKWSRDNGSVVARWLELIVAEDKIRVELPTRDETRGFSTGQWIELSDERQDLHGQPGILVKLLNVDGDLLTFDPVTASGNIEAFFTAAINPKVRRWDMTDGAIFVPAPVADPDGGYIELEDGVEVRFELDPNSATPDVATFHVGDFWLIPARTITGDILWPRQQSGGTIIPLAQKPAGIRHHFTCLASFFLPGFTNYVDCRKKFPPLTDPRGTPTDTPLPGQFRYYLVDGNITPAPTGVVGIDNVAAVAHSRARPFPSIQAVMDVFPRDGNDSTAIILIKPLTGSQTYPELLRLQGLHSYRKVLIRGSDLTNTDADKIICAAQRVASFPDGIAVVDRQVNDPEHIVRVGNVFGGVDQANLVGRRIRFSENIVDEFLPNLCTMFFSIGGTFVTAPTVSTTTTTVSRARSGDVFFVETPGARVEGLFVGSSNDDRRHPFPVSIVGIGTDAIELSPTGGSAEIAFCTANVFDVDGFHRVSATGEYSDEEGFLRNVGAAARITDSDFAVRNGWDVIMRNVAAVSSSTGVSVRNVGQALLGIGVKIEGLAIRACRKFTLGEPFPGDSVLTHVTAEEALIEDSDGEIFKVFVPSDPSFLFRGTGRSLKIGLLTGADFGDDDIALDLTLAFGCEILVTDHVSGLIRLPGPASAFSGDLKYTDMFDVNGNHLQGTAGSFINKGAALRLHNSPQPNFGVTKIILDEDTNVIGVIRASLGADDIRPLIAGVCQQERSLDDDDDDGIVGMHVTTGYSIIEVVNPPATLPGLVYLMSGGTNAGRVSGTPPTDAQVVRIGTLLKLLAPDRVALGLPDFGLVRLNIDFG